MVIMSHAEFHFNWSFLASGPLEKAGPDRVNATFRNSRKSLVN